MIHRESQFININTKRITALNITGKRNYLGPFGIELLFYGQWLSKITRLSHSLDCNTHTHCGQIKQTFFNNTDYLHALLITDSV